MENVDLESQPQEVDLSEDFLNLETFEFLSRVRELRKVPILKIDVDLSNLSQDQFVTKARRLKAFVEGITKGQEKIATVRGKVEQRSWEANVFCSGVKFITID